eukprot:CAMPEP_0197391264 /NCGR_PEP_ID=MMETSP1165-20131217/2981_1 /TAXON_ID=284809 /ORGANISM="Chrysocystis fragilis, Strain CCMP3189" /LENGTH=35 /DNA_ID= /DNA_START= /DNA_END= /DNA_ORIENTATION=
MSAPQAASSAPARPLRVAMPRRGDTPSTPSALTMP